MSVRSHSAPASADWISDWRSQNPAFAPFVMSSGTSSPRQSSWPGWRTRAYARLLSGMTLPPSTAALGVAQWISSWQATFANPSVPPGQGLARTIHATSGRMSDASSTKPGQGASSLRTSKATCRWGLEPYDPNSPRWAMASGRACSRLLKQALRIGADGSSYWPTPTAQMSANRAEWRVTAQGWRMSAPIDQTGNQIGLREAAQGWTLMWKAVKAMGATFDRPASWAYSHPLHLLVRPGSKHLPGSLVLNPAFTDWIMGWPTGWTDPDRPATGFARWLQRSRIELSRLLSQRLEGALNDF